jgi:hypothetical protein
MAIEREIRLPLAYAKPFVPNYWCSGAGAARQSLHFGEQFHIPEVGLI